MIYAIEVRTGGQTGVDRAALDVAISLRIQHGGWCPKGRLCEFGTIPLCYSLQETDSEEYSVRTILNVIDSDGTLVIVPTWPLHINDGTKLTITETQKKEKPCLIIDLSKTIDINNFIKWIKDHNIKILNVAGPRESQSIGIYKSTKNILTILFNALFLSIENSINTRPT